MAIDNTVYGFGEGAEPGIGEYRYFSNPDGTVTLRRFGRSPKGSEKWFDVPNDKMPPETQMSGSPMRARGRPIQERQRYEARTEAEDLAREGEAAMYRKGSAEAVPMWARPGMHMIEEARKIGSGTMDLDAFLQGTMANLLSPIAPEFFGDMEIDAMQSSFDRAKREKQQDKFFKAFEDETSLSKIGKAAPYAISNYLPGPQMVKAADRIYSGITKGVKESAKAGGTAAGRAIKKVAAMDPKTSPGKFTQKRAQELKDVVVDPLETFVARKKAQPPIQDPFRKDLVSRASGDAALGATESALHYDESAIEGLLSSSVGSAAGRLIGPALERSPINNIDPGEREIIDWWKDKGYRVDPGMDTGRPELQTLTANARTDKKYSEYFDQVDRANNSVVLDVAGKAAGLEPGQLQNMTPERLKSHIANLRGEYDTLVNNTIGRLTRKDFLGVSDMIDDRSQFITKRATLDRLKGVQDEFNKVTSPQRDKRGRFKETTFSGPDYQNFRSKLKSLADSGYKSNDVDENAAARIYTSLIDTLDGGLERGLNESGGTVLADRWKDLNERYAMSMILQDHGLRPSGKIDPSKLSSFLMNDDPRSLLQGRGHRVSNFDKIAQLHDVKRDQRGGGLGRENIDPDDKDVAPENIFQTPAAAKMPLRRRLKGWAYMEGYPAKTGLAYIARPGSTSSALRALEQGLDYHTDPLNSVIGEWEDMKSMGFGNYAGKTWDKAVESLKELGMSDEEIQELKDKYRY